MSSIFIHHDNKPILVVEDNPADSALFAQLVRMGINEDIEILEVSTCDAAIAVLANITPCCCLVDYNLPDSNALDLLLQIREMNHEGGIPFVVMTGDGDEKIAVELMRQGAHDYLNKSEINNELLVRSINNAINANQLQQKVRHLAHYDTLTGLLNRALFMDRIQQAIERCDRFDHSCSLLYIDVDKFKQINDNYGHQAGDFVLKTVGQRIQAHCRTSDSAARLGGDEFVILLEKIEREDIGPATDKLLRAVSESIDFNGQLFNIRLSIGIAHYPHTAANAKQLIHQADEAMYRAKHDGKGQYSQFTLQQKKAWERQSRLENALSNAIECGELSLVYQPIVSIPENTLHSFNVNVRWDFEGEPVPAQDLIKIVSDSGLADSFHVWLLNTAFKQLHHWRQQNEDLKVNLSVLAHRCNDQVLAEVLAEVLDSAVADYGIEASCLQLLFTEEVLLEHPAETTKMIDVIHQKGARLAINHFGADYSSMSYLSSLPIETLFVDQQFFEGIHLNERKRKFVEALIVMTNQLGIKVTAKGVESHKQAAIAAMVDCDYMLGYHFGRPQTYEEDWYRFIDAFPLLVKKTSSSAVNQSN